MSATLATILSQAQGRAIDADSKLDDTKWLKAVAAALLEHSRVRPLEVVEQITGEGVFDYQLDGSDPALASWAPGFSQVLEIVYPYDDSEQNPEALGVEEYRIVKLDTGLWLRFSYVIPSATESALVSYTTPHTLTDEECTVPDGEADAFADLVAACACEALAALYIQSTDSSISADVVDRRTKSQEYRSQAKLFRDSYASKLSSNATQGAGIAAPLDSHFGQISGRRDDYFWHGRIYP
jgi:hypothetical protein